MEIQKKKKYINGKENWLFLHNDSNQVFKEITGKNPQSELSADRWVSLIKKREDFAHEKGVKYLTYIVPNKHCVYESYLPDKTYISSNRLAKLIKNKSLNSVIYTPDQFRDPFSFHKNDTHWTDAGAFIAFIEILQQLGIESKVKLNNSDFTWRFHRGDLTNREGNRKVPFLADKLRGREIFNNGILHVGNISIFSGASEKKRSIIIFGGSSSNQLIDFFCLEFSTVYRVWTQSIDWPLVDELGVNYIISLPRERFMIHPPAADDDMQWNYRQVSALKFLSGVTFEKKYVLGASSQFPHLSCELCINVLAYAVAYLPAEKLNDVITGNKLIDKLSVAQLLGIYCQASKVNICSANRLLLYILGRVIKGVAQESKFELITFLDGFPRDILNPDLLRDSAIFIEKDNINHAMYLMKLAKAARPSGPIINAKIKQYEKLLK